MKKHQLGFIMLSVLLSLVVIGAVSYLTFKNINKKQTLTPVKDLDTASNEVTGVVVPTKETIKEDKSGIKWVTHANKERGVSFQYPDGWDIVYALGSNSTEIDVKSLQKDMLVIIGIYEDKTISNKASIENAIREKEKEFKTSERYLNSKFTSSVSGENGSYTATGEEYYLSLSSDKSLDEIPVVTYKYHERGSFKVGGKTVTLHGMTLAKNPHEDVIAKIIDSFELTNN